jgi:hypothetical protein
MNDDLARRLAIPELVAVYEQAERDILSGFALISGAEKALNDAFTLGGAGSISVRNANGRVHFERSAECLTEVRRSIWRTLVERLELRRIMSVSAWEELQRKLEREEPAPITSETLTQMAEHFRSRLPSMLTDAVAEVFEWLRPRRSQYKTNSELEVGRKVILSWVIERWDKFHTSWSVHYHSEQNLTALENVFSALDGKAPITKGHYSALSTAIKACGSAPECAGETEYFRFKGYRNGKLHLGFKRLDLLKRFNEIAGGARLRPKNSRE